MGFVRPVGPDAAYSTRAGYPREGSCEDHYDLFIVADMARVTAIDSFTTGSRSYRDDVA
jgi:hypothetical protein